MGVDDEGSVGGGGGLGVAGDAAATGTRLLYGAVAPHRPEGLYHGALPECRCCTTAGIFFERRGEGEDKSRSLKKIPL